MTQKQYDIVNSVLETEMISEAQLPSSITTAVGDVSVMTSSMVPAIPGTTMKMVMNRHRRSRYEQEPLHSALKNNISFATSEKVLTIQEFVISSTIILFQIA